MADLQPVSLYRTDLPNLIDLAIAADATRCLDLPHVLHVYDRVLGTATVLGPFPDPIRASEFAERYLDDVAASGDARESLRLDVIPLESVEAPCEAQADGGHTSR